jgi:hypothetical protein
VFHKHDHPVRERLETMNRFNSKRCAKEFALVAQFNPGTLRAGSIEVMPQVPKEMWPEIMRILFFWF